MADTSTRVAHLLLRHFDAKGHNLLHDLPQREVASMIGSVRIVVSRSLAQLRRRGAVELRDGTIRVVDLKRLLANGTGVEVIALPRERMGNLPAILLSDDTSAHLAHLQDIAGDERLRIASPPLRVERPLALIEELVTP